MFRSRSERGGSAAELRPFRRALEGALAGALIGVLEVALSEYRHGFRMPAGHLPGIAVLSAIWLALAWLGVELAAAAVPRGRRPANRLLLCALLTGIALFLSHRTYAGSLAVGRMRFWAELTAAVAAALLVWRVALRWPRPCRVAAVSAGALACLAIAADLFVRAALPPASGASAERPNVVLVLVDTLRIDRMSLFGGARKTTPNLEGLATESFLFRRAYAPSSWTSPSVASLFTGLLARDHGLHRLGAGLAPEPTTIAERFASAGYRTFASVTNRIVTPFYGFDRGFQEFNAPTGNLFFRTLIGFVAGSSLQRSGLSALVAPHDRVVSAFLRPGEGLHGRNDEFAVADFRAWLGERPREPLFAYLHLMAPHDPYGAPAPFRGRFWRPVARSGQPAPREMPAMPSVGERPTNPSLERLLALYDEEVLAVDHAIGSIVALLRENGMLDRTLLAVVSDHGEEFLDHGGWRHGHHCFEEVSRGLLMVRFPNGTRAGESAVPVTMRDLPALLLESAGLAPLPAGGSRRLLSLIESPADDVGTPVLVEHYPRFARENPSFAVIDGRWKLLRHGGPGNAREWLFDLDRSPDEQAAVAEPAVQARLAKRLDEHLTNVQEDPQPPVAGAVEDLRSLGYVQ